MTDKHLILLSLFKEQTGGRTTHTPGEIDNPAKLSQYFRDRSDLNNGSDTSRWR